MRRRLGFAPSLDEEGVFRGGFEAGRVGACLEWHWQNACCTAVETWHRPEVHEVMGRADPRSIMNGNIIARENGPSLNNSLNNESSTASTGDGGVPDESTRCMSHEET